MSDMELLERERASPDLNIVRAQQRQNLTKKVFEDNLKLQGQSVYDHQKGQELRYSQSTDLNGAQVGDIFDPLFERPKHWRNFYGNIVQGHQMAKISKHEEKFLQSQMLREKQREHEIDGGVVRQRMAESLNDMKKSQLKNEKRNNFQREITELYNQIQAKKEYDKEDRKAFFIERGIERRDRIEDEKRQQIEKFRARRFEQNQYKDILDVQRNEMDERRYNRHRMTDVEHKSNQDDLQEFKQLGLYVHTRSVPGLAPSIDPNMAKRVLGLFNK